MAQTENFETRRIFFDGKSGDRLANALKDAAEAIFEQASTASVIEEKTYSLVSSSFGEGNAVPTQEPTPLPELDALDGIHECFYVDGLIREATRKHSEVIEAKEDEEFIYNVSKPAYPTKEAYPPHPVCPSEPDEREKPHSSLYLYYQAAAAHYGKLKREVILHINRQKTKGNDFGDKIVKIRKVCLPDGWDEKVSEINTKYNEAQAKVDELEKEFTAIHRRQYTDALREYQAAYSKYSAEVKRIDKEHTQACNKIDDDYDAARTEAETEWNVKHQEELRELTSRPIFADIKADMLAKSGDGDWYLHTNLRDFKLSEYGIVYVRE